MSLPFTQSDIYLGFAEISGLLQITGQTLQMEYRVKDTTLGLLDSSVKSCHIPLHIIHSVDVEKKWFSVKFEITFNRTPDLDNPFQLEEENILTLSVKKKDFEKAKTFRSVLMYEIPERKTGHPPKEKESFSHRKTRPEQTHSSRQGGLDNILREE